MTTPNTYLQQRALLNHALEVIGFDKEQVKHIRETCKVLRLDSLEALVNNEKLKSTLLDVNLFPIPEELLLEKLVRYIRMYRGTNKSLEGFKESFNAEAWNELGKLDNTVIKTQSDPIMTMPSKMTEMKIRMSDYPTFNGKYVSWPAFYEEFGPIAKVQGLEDVLEYFESTEDDDLHLRKIEEDEKYKHRVHTLYNILHKACARGIALLKVKTFQDAKDGHLAWKALCTEYKGQDNIDDNAGDMLQKLTQIRLDYNTIGGMEGYISKIEEVVLLSRKLDNH